jgi:hypothetical protein
MAPRILTLPVSALVLLVIAAGAAPAGASAQPAESSDAATTWSLVPADADGPDGRRQIDVELEPGEQAVERVALTNGGDTAVTFDLVAADGYLTDAGSFDLRARDVEPTGGGAWIELDDAVTVPPGETAVVPFTVAVPERATPGDHPAGVAASVTSSDGVVTVDHRVGVRVDVHVPGEVVAAVDVTDVVATHHSSWNPFEPGEVTVDAVVTGAGNVVVDVAEHVEVTGPFGLGGPVEARSSDDVELIPGSSVRTTLPVADVWPLGRVTVELTVTPTPADGADVVATPRTVTVTTWALPWPQLLAVLLLVMVVLGIRALVAARRERLRRMLDAARAEGAAQAAQRATQQVP